MLLNLFYAWIALMPFLSVSPWQVIVAPPFYYGFVYYLILFIISFFVIIEILRGKISFKLDPAILLIAFYYLVAIISVMQNWNIPVVQADRGSGIKSIHLYSIFLLIYLLFNTISVFIVSKIVNNIEKLTKVLTIIKWTSLTACVWGIMLVLLQDIPRLMGTATEPQVFGNFLILPLFIMWANYLNNMKIINTMMLFCAILAMLMTFSIGAWIGALAGGMAFICFNYKYFKLKMIAYLILIFFSSVFILSAINFINPEYSKGLVISKMYFWKVQEEVEEYKVIRKEVSDDKKNRLWMAQAAINMFKDNPWKGVGIGNYTFLYNQYKPQYAPPEQNAKAHNAYLEVLAETGLGGALLFFSWLGLIGWRGFNTLKRINMPQDRLLFTGIFCGLIGLLAHGFGLGIFFHNYTWIALGLVLACNNIYEK